MPKEAVALSVHQAQAQAEGVGADLGQFGRRHGAGDLGVVAAAVGAGHLGRGAVLAHHVDAGPGRHGGQEVQDLAARRSLLVASASGGTAVHVPRVACQPVVSKCFSTLSCFSGAPGPSARPEARRTNSTVRSRVGKQPVARESPPETDAARPPGNPLDFFHRLP